MKKIILLLIFCLAVNLNAKEYTQTEKDLAGRIVEAMGYICKKVDNARRWSGSRITTVYCDEFARAYELEKIGTKWVVRQK